MTGGDQIKRRLHPAIAIGRALEGKSRQTLQVGRRLLEPLALEGE